MKINRSLVSLCCAFMSLTVNAVNSNVPVATAKVSASSATVPTKVTASASASLLKSNPCGLTTGVLTGSNIDTMWRKREDTTCQQDIAKFLLQKPKITHDYATAWKMARLVYFIGNYGVGEKSFADTDAGVQLFAYGRDIGLAAQKLNPNGVEGYYWYAVDLGSWGLAKGLLASASNAKDGMTALNKAKSIDPTYWYYGSSRILGRYYQQLPGIFGGDNNKAKQMLTDAVTQAPQFKDNWNFLGQFYLSQKDYKNALAACTKGLSIPTIKEEGVFENKRHDRELGQCVGAAKAGLS